MIMVCRDHTQLLAWGEGRCREKEMNIWHLSKGRDWNAGLKEHMGHRVRKGSTRSFMGRAWAAFVGGQRGKEKAQGSLTTGDGGILVPRAEFVPVLKHVPSANPGNPSKSLGIWWAARAAPKVLQPVEHTDTEILHQTFTDQSYLQFPPQYFTKHIFNNWCIFK